MLPDFFGLSFVFKHIFFDFFGFFKNVLYKSVVFMLLIETRFYSGNFLYFQMLWTDIFLDFFQVLLFTMFFFRKFYIFFRLTGSAVEWMENKIKNGEASFPSPPPTDPTGFHTFSCSLFFLLTNQFENSGCSEDEKYN